MRPGVRLGIDVGKARIGIAQSDPEGLLAMPVETLPRAQSEDSDIEHICMLAGEVEAIEIIVGLPLSLSGAHTLSTQDAEDFALRCARGGRHPVRLVDERLTTVTAQSALHNVGKNTKKSRSVIDQVAAVILLQQALDVERASGKPPGFVVDSTQG